MAGIRIVAALLAIAVIITAFAAPVAAQTGNIAVQKSDKNLASTLSGISDASMANTMIKAAGLDKTLASGTHTIFIPSDSSMTSMGFDLSKVYGFMTDKGMATKTMRGLVMEGSVAPSDLTKGKALTMINGQTMFITDTGGQTALDGVRITRGYQTTNGMIYVLDSIPSSMLQNIKTTIGMLA